MTTRYKSLTALGLSTALLASASLTACSSESGDAGETAEQGTSASDTSDASAGPSAPAPAANPAPAGEMGEGEGGEGEGGEGEGGEGGVNIAAAASDPAVYANALAIVEAHVRAAMDAMADGETEAAAEMFAHPVSEILLDLEPVLQERGVEPFDQMLLDASRAVFEDETVEEINARADEIIVTLRDARSKAPDDGTSEAVVAAKTVADQIDRAIAQYSAAQGSDAYEPYLDGYGFYKTAQALFAEQEAAIRSEAPDFVEAAEPALAALGNAYPTAARPDTLEADVSAMTVANSQVQLAASGL